MSPGSGAALPATALTVALGRECAASLPEVKYALRTLLRIAGYGCRFVWREDGVTADIVYGAAEPGVAALRIPFAGHDFTGAAGLDATGSRHWNGLPFLLFPGEPWLEPSVGGEFSWPCDIVFATYWLLTGARETTWPRDRWDNLEAHEWVPVRDGLLTEAPVSRWGQAIRDHFGALGRPGATMPWQTGSARTAFSFSHDVDYPQIIRWIEAPRLLLQRGFRGLRPALDVVRGTSHFWTFREWIELEGRFGARPTFYFMARRGSLLEYALGRPDDFYDIRRPEFTRLFAELRDAGCEIGLHASFHAHRSAETMRVEAERVAHASGMPVAGNRHHFWHLDPDDPNETLRRHELAGLQYDTSLSFEFFPGFRRGICHPFHPFHPGERRELAIVQVPPAWMDDHFGRRRAVNRVTDPDRVARRILQTARETGGVAVVDYHSRGMNTAIYPDYGPWLRQFAERELDASVAFRTPGEIGEAFRAVTRVLDAVSSDRTIPGAAAPLSAPAAVEFGPMRRDEAAQLAALHFELFGDADFNGRSVAMLGRRFLEQAFYRLNVENPALFVTVARWGGRVVGFCVYSPDKESAFAHPRKRHPIALAQAVAAALIARPARVLVLMANLRYLRAEPLPFARDVPGLWVVMGVHPDARSPEFERRTGTQVAAGLFDRMEADLKRVGCPAWYCAVRGDNAAINAFLRRRRMEEAGAARAQGLEMRYYLRRYRAGAHEEPDDPAR